jgi:CMP-N-acetylneuraminic acid synthetase
LRLLITICARGGSKGIPGKNIKLLNGKPLIAYTIQTAQKFGQLYDADIALSTDDEQIKNVAADYGLLTSYSRPVELASDIAGKVETLADLLIFQEKSQNKLYDYILDMDVTSPLRTVEDLDEAFSMIRNDEEAYNIFSVNPANRNPYFNMVEQKENGYYGLVKQGDFKSRQVAPKVYDMNASFYFFKRSFFNSGLKTSTTNKSMIYIVRHTCFDLDHPIDFEFISYLISNNKLGFEL